MLNKVSFWGQVPFAKYFSPYECINILLCVIFFTMWNVIATKTFSLQAEIFFIIVCVLSLLLGKMSLRAVAHKLQLHIDFPLAFICGFFLLSTALFIMALVTPFSIIQNFIILCVLSAIACFCSKVLSTPLPEEKKSTDDGLYGLLITILALVSATIWVHSILNPIKMEGGMVIFKPWYDAFCHASSIRMLGDTHGISSFQDPLLSGQLATPYHYASYAIPALFGVFAHISRYIVFASLYVPLGIFLMILGAYALIKSLWGSFPGIIAAAALFLLPDAAQQGLSNYFLSFHWFMPTAPAAAYGITIISIAWIFLLKGCQKSAVMPILISYCIALLSVLYKAQFFLINSFVIWIFPCLFMKNIVLRKRLLWLVASVVAYFLTVYITRDFKYLPYLDLRGTNMIEYLQTIVASIENMHIKNAVSNLFDPQVTVKTIIFGSALLSTFTFGFFLISAVIALILLRKRIDLSVLFFPIFIVISYLVMSLGLPFDTRGITTPTGIVHAFSAWAYYAFVIWSVGGLAFYFLKNGLSQNAYGKIAWAVIVCCLFFLAYRGSRNIIQGPVWGAQYVNFKAPADLVRVCSFIRDNSNSGDVVQDSKNDPYMLIVALSERQGYAVNAYSSVLLPSNPVLQSRLAKLEKFKMLTSSDAVIDFARTNRITWFILQPDDAVSWPQSFVKQPFYQSGGFRLYKF